MLARRIKYLPDSIWPALDHLCWFLLFPLLIIRTLSQADLSGLPVKDLGYALLIAVSMMVILLLIMKPLLTKSVNLTGPGYTSFFQGTSRWNGFAALAIIQALYGESGLVLGALSFAVMVPFLQTINVIILSIYGQPVGYGKVGFSVKGLGLQLVKNPMLISISIGIGLNLINISVGPLFSTTIDLVAGSALGLALLAVGAGLNFSSLNNAKVIVVISSILKLLIMPVFIIFACSLLTVTGLSREVAVVCGAAPTAGTAYIMAKQMGGDADMVAAIITFQTLAAVFTLPLMLYLLI